MGTPTPARATTSVTGATTTTTPAQAATPAQTSVAPPNPATADAVPLPIRVRAVTEQPWTPFATVGGITLRNPSSRVERVGFHEANHDGAQQQEVLPTAIAPVTEETRDRPTESRTAADVVVDPAVEIRAPVSGTVIEGGTYVLYCHYSDDYLIIEPDEHPGWQVKVLHINGLQVGVGDRVTVAETVIAPGPTLLPFASEIDDFRTADPAWPHVHIEVIDPIIPDLPSPGDSC